MSEQITALNPADIQRGGGVSTDGAGGNQPPAVPEDKPAAPMPEATAKGYAKLDELREQAKDPVITREQRDGLFKKMDELARHLSQGNKAPQWYTGAADPKLTDASEFDGMRDTLAKTVEPISTQQVEHLATHGSVKGLDRGVSRALADKAGEVGMSDQVARTIMERAAHHFGATFDEAALDKIPSLSAAEEKEYLDVAARNHPGGMEAFAKLSEEVRAGLEQRAPELLRMFERTSLAYDARTLHALRYWLQSSEGK